MYNNTMITMVEDLSNNGQLLASMFVEILKVKEKFEAQQNENKMYVRLLGRCDRLYVGIEYINGGTDALGYIYVTNLNTPKIEKFVEMIIEKLVKNYGYNHIV
jgi:hypothetical protein